MSSLEKMVYQFNQEVRQQPQPLRSRKLNKDELKARVTFVLEETKELLEAETAVEQLDALIDLMYFTIGGVYDMGLSEYELYGAFQRVHHANMAKVGGNKEGRNVNTKDAAKPEGWTEPDLGSYF